MSTYINLCSPRQGPHPDGARACLLFALETKPKAMYRVQPGPVCSILLTEGSRATLSVVEPNCTDEPNRSEYGPREVVVWCSYGWS
jgi:hypothetical protein